MSQEYSLRMLAVRLRFVFLMIFSKFNKLFIFRQVHARLLVLGTQWGRVYILDHQGNQVRDQTRPVGSGDGLGFIVPWYYLWNVEK